MDAVRLASRVARGQVNPLALERDCGEEESKRREQFCEDEKEKEKQ